MKNFQVNTIPIVLTALCCIAFACSPNATEQDKKATNNSASTEKYTLRGYSLLSNNKQKGIEILNAAKQNGVNYVELSHYQLTHDLKDLKKEANRQSTNFFIDEVKKRGMKAYVWDHAFYNLSYYPDRFKVDAPQHQDLTHHTAKFIGGVEQQLNLDDPEFWQWVYADYDSLLALAPNLDGITLTFIETGSYVIYQHSDKLKTPSDKLAALVDSLANYFIDRKGLKLHIRSFIYNKFEKENVFKALQKIKHPDLTVMVKMVYHDWFLTYPYQREIGQIPYHVVIEYDGGMEYAGENIIANSFVPYFTRTFKHYNQYSNVVGYCVRVNRFGSTCAIGTPGEANLYALSQLCIDTTLTADEITTRFLNQKYGAAAAKFLKPAFDSAMEVILSSMYTLGQHTANHSRLHFLRPNIYLTHTTGEWYAPNKQMRFVEHRVNKHMHNYKDVIEKLAFAAYKKDTVGLKKDIGFVLDSGWLSANNRITPEFFTDIKTEKQYGVALAENNLALVKQAKPLITDTALAQQTETIFERTVVFARERAAVATAVYGFRLWCKAPKYQTKALKDEIMSGLNQADSLITYMENNPAPSGQWNWYRDREEFSKYQKAILHTGWPHLGLNQPILKTN